MKTNSIIQLLKEHKINIPPIQRDYAHGRSTSKVNHIRELFLNAIVEALSDNSKPPLELDFVYGYTVNDRINSQSEVSVFKPLDGQQRLTTLFLIHWFIANKEGKMSEARDYLSKFSYATRQSSRSFCEKLISFTPDTEELSIDQKIINEPWFFSSWHSDPTIISMLVVLKAIEEKFGMLENVWEQLAGENPKVIFHLLPMKDLGLPDDLYIKMNARGKELTDFEHFKSQFSEILDSKNAILFNEKIDKGWSDLFWNVFKGNESTDIAKDVDGGFLSFFWYITDLLIAKNNILITDSFWLNVIKTVYKDQDENAQFLFRTLNLFERLEKENPQYFDAIFYVESSDYDIKKTRLFFNSAKTNLFRKCAETYGFEGKSNNFSIGEQLMLYAVIFMELENKMDWSKFRKLRNIFSSSEDQLRKDYLSAFLYKDIESIIDSNKYSSSSKLSTRQYKEEIDKDIFLESFPELKDVVYRLEDHTLLRGNISIFTFDNSLSNIANIFLNLFIPDCNYFEISRAMLTIGNYSQIYGNLTRLGNKNNSTWRDLFTQSEARKGFENSSGILKKYLESFVTNVSISNQSIIDNYLSNTETYKDWKYYYIKYQSFILWDGSNTNGFYKWDDIEQKPYECTMLYRTQFNGRHWSPFLLELFKMNSDLQLGNYGDDLQYTNGGIILMIKNCNAGFMFYATDDYSLSILNKLIADQKLNSDGLLLVRQNENGIDYEDRIIKCQEFLISISI